MGQRFSELKVFFGAMEPSSKDSNESNTTLDISTTSCVTNNVRNIPGRVIERQSSDNNGNDEAAANGLNEHFENIYSNSENSKSEEENGNIEDKPSISNPISDGACSSQTLGTHRCASDSGRSHKDNTCSSSTSRKLTCQKQPNRQKNFHKLLKLHKEMNSGSSKKKRNHWVLRFNCARLKSGSTSSTCGSENDIAEPNVSCNACVCTGYRRTEDHNDVVLEATPPSVQQGQNDSSQSSDSSGDEGAGILRAHPVIDLSKFNPEDYPIEDCDERARVERAREIAEGVEPPPGFRPGQHIQLLFPSDVNISNLTALLNSAALSAFTQLDVQRIVHTQVDYIHCLVPDLLQITSCSFYWGKMDRYEAERLLESRPEGTFLLRDSAQEEYLFSVSFRKYGRSLHARIEQWNHHFSFDSHDPGVYASSTVCGLIEHYKDPSCCMFFEPMLTIPLHRNFPFPLQHLCRAVVCNLTSYDGISQLRLPKALKSYLKEYHYKQRIRVRRFDAE